MADGGFCYDRCNACGHIHAGVERKYACLSCDCSDRHECEATS